MNMASKFGRVASIAAVMIALAGAQSLFAAGNAARTDKDSMIGAWTVKQGVYPDKTVETELEMSFTFTARTMTEPMEGAELAWTIDEKAKTITARGDKGAMTLAYKIVDAKTMELTRLVVKDPKGKETVIVGDGGTFASLTLKRK